MTEKSHSFPMTVEQCFFKGALKVRYPEDLSWDFDASLFLASSISSCASHVLNIGCSFGAIPLFISHRLPFLKIVGMDPYRALLKFASENISDNYKKANIEIFYSDLVAPLPRLAGGSFNQICVDALYLESLHDPNQKISPLQRIDSWARFSLLMCKPLGEITFLHSLDRLSDLMHYFYGKMGSIEIYPLWYSCYGPAPKAIIKGIKNAPSHVSLHPGLAVYDQHNKLTHEAELILKHGESFF